MKNTLGCKFDLVLALDVVKELSLWTYAALMFPSLFIHCLSTFYHLVPHSVFGNLLLFTDCLSTVYLLVRCAICWSKLLKKRVFEYG